ncbi:MAG: efflux RND transporter periplasmic adaptor subunit [Myxococcota bacterium]|nr:efflux RND transporter periplasmic adaptor subunit [Myxococcota bacterium]
MMRRFPFFIALALVGCGAEGGVELPASAQAAGEAEPVQVATRAPEAREVEPSVHAVGTAEPIRAADLGPQVTGAIVDLPVSEGQLVEENAIIARLDARSIRAGAAQAASSAQGIDAQVRQLEQELTRLRPLAQRGTIPSQQVDQMELQLEGARAQLAAARSGASQARTAVSNTTVRAPFAGVISQVGMEVGETATVAPPSTIARLVDLSAVEIAARIPERELARVREGAAAEVRFPALDQSFEGAVSRIAPEIDTQSRTVEIVVRVDNPERLIRGGMSAEVTVRAGGTRTAMVLPAEATRGMGDARRVFVLRDGHAEERSIRVQPLGAGTVEIVEGLEADESVISPLPPRLRDGTPVRTQTAAASSEGAAVQGETGADPT